MFDSILNRVKAYLHSKRVVMDDEIKISKPIAAQEDRTQIDAQKQASRIWKSQRQETKVRALVAHDPTCKDPFACKKDKCHVVSIDKVHKPKKISKAQMQKELEFSKKMIAESLSDHRNFDMSKSVPEALEFNEEMKKDIKK